MLNARLTVGELVDNGSNVVALACAVVLFEVLYVEFSLHGVPGSRHHRGRRAPDRRGARERRRSGETLPLAPPFLRFVPAIEHVNADPVGDIEVADGVTAAGTVNGGLRLGPVVVIEAVGGAMARTDEYDVGCVGVHDSTHLMMLGYYTKQLRDTDCVGLTMTNTEPAMPPHSGAESVFGTTSIVVGLPTDPPFNLNMSTSRIARGTVLYRKETASRFRRVSRSTRTASRRSAPWPHWRGPPLRGREGVGLVIAVEVLVGALMGREVIGTYHTENPCIKGDLFVTIDPDALVGERFAVRVSEFHLWTEGGKPDGGCRRIRLPDEHSTERDRTATGVEVDDDL